jgi:hypothetical protein
LNANSASGKGKAMAAASRVAVAADRAVASKADDKFALRITQRREVTPAAFYVYILSAKDVEQEQLVIFLRYQVQPFCDAVPPACPTA